MATPYLILRVLLCVEKSCSALYVVRPPIDHANLFVDALYSVTLCCSVLQCVVIVAVRCSVGQYVTVRRSALKCVLKLIPQIYTPTHIQPHAHQSTCKHTASHHITLHHAATHYHAWHLIAPHRTSAQPLTQPCTHPPEFKYFVTHYHSLQLHAPTHT